MSYWILMTCLSVYVCVISVCELPQCVLPRMCELGFCYGQELGGVGCIHNRAWRV